MEARLQEGIDAKNDGRPEDAVHVFLEILATYPEDFAANFLLGGIYHTYLKEHKAAIPYLRKATELSPKHEMASLGLFHSLWKLGEEYDALEEMKRYQILTDWNCQDYVEILEEITEKNEAEEAKRTKGKPRSRKRKTS